MPAYLPLNEYWAVGRTAKRPFRIFAALDMASFGDFVSSLFVVNCIAERFDHRIVTVLYRGDPPYRSELVKLLPNANYIEVPGGASFPSIDIVTPPAQVPRNPDFDAWFKGEHSYQDLFITSNMALAGFLSTFDRLCHLRVPDARAASCAAELVGRGIDPERWFCTVHAREPGYAGKAAGANLRDCNPQIFWEAIVHVVTHLGGQVVRLGDPAMTPFPELAGVVDLTRDPPNPMLQAFAVSRSRFLLCGPSGPCTLADALNVPCAMIDAMEHNPCNERAVVRTVDLIMPDGRLYRQKELFEAGYSKMEILRLLALKQGYRVMKGGPEELKRLANFVHGMTADTPGWRTPAGRDASHGRPNQFSWPPGEPRERGCFLPV